MGMRQRLGLAAALLGDPQVLDPRRARQRPGPRGHPLAARLPAPPVADEGKTVLVSSHLLQEVEQTVDDVVIIANGSLRQAGRDGRPRTASAAPSSVRRTRRARASPARGRRRPGAGRGRRRCSSTTDRPAPDRRRGARAPGCPVWELRRRDADLEALFFELTEGTNRNLGEAVVITGARSSVRQLRKFFTTRLWWGMAIGLLAERGGFSLLFGLLYTSRASSRSPAAAARSAASRRATTRRSPTASTPRPQRRLPADAGDRRHPDRRGVPPQDHHEHLPRAAEAATGDARPR